MHNFFNFRRSKKNVYVASAFFLVMFTWLPSFAQVVNSGASSTSANSQITMTATIPTIVIVKVDPILSKLSTIIRPNVIDSGVNVSSTDFTINGAVTSNSATANIQTKVSSLSLQLAYGTSNITLNMRGTIGGKAISTTAFTPIFTNKSASIQIIGDLDETTITSQKTPGNYTGSLIITATVQ